VVSTAGLIAGHRVLVTGAASGIGQAVMELALAHGATVVGVDLQPSPAIVGCDVTDEASVAAAFAIAGQAGAITDVVNCAGVYAAGAVADMSLASWQRVIGVNLTGSFLVGRAAANILPRGGTCIFIASKNGLRGEARASAYSASKFGVIGLMESLSRELAPRGIRVNAVCPGGVETPMYARTIEAEARVQGISVQELRRANDARVPLGGQARPSQIADVCLFLMSSLSSHIAGAAIEVNGAE
jgi:meso-butanediol dehydrogenase/(S,S)-butanediol dehydrogenase/diacetyl reductase